jgi:hypothetical protein
MERLVRKFGSHEEARRATLEYYRGLSPTERLDILLRLIERARKEDDASSQRLERVCRVVELHRS